MLNNLLFEYKELLFKALQNNLGLKKILSISYEYLKNPIVLLDTSFSIISNFPEDHDYELDFDKIDNKYYMKTNIIQELKRKQIIQELHTTSRPFITTHETTKESMIFCNIKINDTIVGFVCVAQINEFPEENFLKFIDYLADIISIEMQKFEFFTDLTGENYEYFLIELLNSNISNLNNIEKYFLELSFKVKHYNWIMLIDFQKYNSTSINKKFFIKQITNIIPNSMCINYKGYITVLFSKNDFNAFTKQEKERLIDFLNFNSLYATLSFSFKNIIDAPIYYEQAIGIINCCNTTQKNKLILLYEDYCLQHILSLFNNSPTLKASVHPDILRIQEYDTLNNTEYIHTLNCYLNSNRNSIETASKLHIHKSTLFYRLSKITELFGIDYKNNTMLFAYEFSLKVLYNYK